MGAERGVSRKALLLFQFSKGSLNSQASFKTHFLGEVVAFQKGELHGPHWDGPWQSLESQGAGEVGGDFRHHSKRGPACPKSFA